VRADNRLALSVFHFLHLVIHLARQGVHSVRSAFDFLRLVGHSVCSVVHFFRSAFHFAGPSSL